MNTLFANIYLGLSTVAGKLRREEKGATAVEYGLMVALIAVAIITAVALIGTNMDLLFDKVAGKIPTVIP
ncbi:Flp family type IVb pilin [Paeniglutamicibacter psychrophenolicus]|uniref:Flp family type IVb pilin n=1 Tax=Paeniglutamicibacter psychrophenolicus TaxID=257454 RepID=UPI0027875B7E|nr:Flp family type IVb pilin [Paeniglutamicibacter psychrophenolicus]MDQ0092548.1 pilus assembly protein Flp/PilA [Paeniglutamicibacter psychrophenolicus]